MDSIICKYCNKVFTNEASLHKHLKAHKLCIAEYYRQYYPRYDKCDGGLIKFHNKEQYFSTDFNHRENLKKWVENNDLSITRPYCKAILEARIKKKNLKWALSQVELRTAMMPPIQSYNALFGNYYALCEEIGLKTRFDDNTNIDIYSSIPYFICIDSREKKPLKFTRRVVTHGLKYGDYVAIYKEQIYPCRIERKSPQDFLGTLSGGYQRFYKEIEKAKKDGNYIVVLIECPLNVCLDFRNQSTFFYKNVKITPEFVFHNVRELLQTFDNVQFLFVKDRDEASKVIELIFDSSCKYTKVDLQYWYDIGKLV